MADFNIENWEDGVEYIIPYGSAWTHGCCACGLVHDVVLRLTKEGVGLTFTVNEDATQHMRDMLTIKYLKEPKEENNEPEGIN